MSRLFPASYPLTDVGIGVGLLSYFSIRVSYDLINESKSCGTTLSFFYRAIEVRVVKISIKQMKRYSVSLWMLLASLLVAPLFTSCEEFNDNEEDDIYVNIIGGGSGDGEEKDYIEEKNDVSIVGSWRRSGIQYGHACTLILTFNENGSGSITKSVSTYDGGYETDTIVFSYQYEKNLGVLKMSLTMDEDEGKVEETDEYSAFIVSDNGVDVLHWDGYAYTRVQ